MEHRLVSCLRWLGKSLKLLPLDICPPTFANITLVMATFIRIVRTRSFPGFGRGSLYGKTRCPVPHRVVSLPLAYRDNLSLINLYSPVLCRSSMGMYGSYFFISIRAMVCIIWYGCVYSLLDTRRKDLTLITTESKHTMAHRYCPSFSGVSLELAGRTSTMSWPKMQISRPRFF